MKKYCTDATAKKEEMIEINGKVYPLWSQFVERKKEWIGGILEDIGDSMDRALGYKGAKTEITDITLKPNGNDSAFFTIHGKGFDCGFDVQVGGISGNSSFGNEEGWICFSGYGNHEFRISQSK